MCRKTLPFIQKEFRIDQPQRFFLLHTLCTVKERESSTFENSNGFISDHRHVFNTCVGALESCDQDEGTCEVCALPCENWESYCGRTAKWRKRLYSGQRHVFNTCVGALDLCDQDEDTCKVCSYPIKNWGSYCGKRLKCGKVLQKKQPPPQEKTLRGKRVRQYL